MAVSDDELQAQVKTNKKLREQLAEAQSKENQRHVEAGRELRYAQLKAEEARLQAQLDAAKRSAQAGSVKDAVSGPLAAAREQMEAAVAVQKAQAKAEAEADKDKEN